MIHISRNFFQKSQENAKPYLATRNFLFSFVPVIKKITMERSVMHLVALPEEEWGQFKNSQMRY